MGRIGYQNYYGVNAVERICSLSYHLLLWAFYWEN